MENNNKNVLSFILFGILLVVICCNALYSKSAIDFIYLLIVAVYFCKYICIKKKSISD